MVYDSVELSTCETEHRPTKLEGRTSSRVYPPSGTRGAAGRRVTRPWGRGVNTPPKHLAIFEGAPLRLPTPLADQVPVRVCSHVPFGYEPSVKGALCAEVIRPRVFNPQIDETKSPRFVNLSIGFTRVSSAVAACRRQKISL